MAIEITTNGFQVDVKGGATPSDERIQDAIASLLAAGDKLSWSYNDANDTLTIDTTALDEQEIEDEIDATLSPGDKLTTSYDGDIVSLDTSALDEEEVEDTVNALLSAGDKLSWTYDDANDDLQVDTTALDNEEVLDAVAGFVESGNNLSWAHDDPNDTLTVSLNEDVSLTNLTIKSGGSVSLPDTDKILFGDGNDYSIYFDPTAGQNGAFIHRDEINTDVEMKFFVGGGIEYSNQTIETKLNEGEDIFKFKDSSTGDEFRTLFTTGGIFTKRAYDSSTDTTSNIYQIDPATQQLDMLATLAFPNLTGTPTFASHDHSEGGLTAVPNAGLVNDTITVTGGNALTGGSAALGSSLTIDVDTDSIQTDELDLSISPTWTGSHTFGGGLTMAALLDLNSNDLADGTQTIWDTSAQEIPDSALGSIDNATLTNNTVTVSSGDGIKGGATISLGGSTTLNIEPADFAGSFVSDDGADNLQVNIGNGLEGDGADNIQVNEDYDFTFTSAIDFSAGLDTQGDITDGTQIIWDATAQEVPDSALGSIANSTLTNDTITLAGRSVALGGTQTLGLSHLDDYDLAGSALLDTTGPVTVGDAATMQDLMDLQPITEPAAPGTGDVRVFVDSADSNLKAKDPAGDVVTIVTT